MSNVYLLTNGADPQPQSMGSLPGERWVVSAHSTLEGAQRALENLPDDQVLGRFPEIEIYKLDPTPDGVEDCVTFICLEFSGPNGKEVNGAWTDHEKEDYWRFISTLVDGSPLGYCWRCGSEELHAYWWSLSDDTVLCEDCVEWSPEAEEQWREVQESEASPAWQTVESYKDYCEATDQLPEEEQEDFC